MGDGAGQVNDRGGDVDDRGGGAGRVVSVVAAWPQAASAAMMLLAAAGMGSSPTGA